jgi:hypothetical protein
MSSQRTDPIVFAMAAVSASLVSAMNDGTPSRVGAPPPFLITALSSVGCCGAGVGCCGGCCRAPSVASATAAAPSVSAARVFGPLRTFWIIIDTQN